MLADCEFKTSQSGSAILIHHNPEISFRIFLYPDISNIPVRIQSSLALQKPNPQSESAAQRQSIFTMTDA